MITRISRPYWVVCQLALLGIAAWYLASGISGIVQSRLQRSSGDASVGVIQINWAKLSEHFGALGDVNGDGTVDAADAEAAIEQLQKRLTANMGPAAGGFGGGLLLGLRYG